MENGRLTIFTPTYNRAYILEKLYNSLKEQTNRNFEWMIVDDGSEDNTEKLVKKWIDEKKVDIKYFKQKNGGKQRAHNRGTKECDTELFLCVDSDDYIVKDSVEKILRKWQEVCADKKVAGIVALRGKDEKNPLGTDMPKIKYSTLWELYSKYKFQGDTSLVYRTEILKQYPYWVAEEEKFIGEGYVYQQIDQMYYMALLPEIVIVCRYLNDGYTKNVRKLTKNNPISYTELKRMTVSNSRTWTERYYHTILYLVGCKMSREKHPFKRAPYKVLAILGMIPAQIVWMKYYKNA